MEKKRGLAAKVTEFLFGAKETPADIEALAPAARNKQSIAELRQDIIKGQGFDPLMVTSPKTLTDAQRVHYRDYKKALKKLTSRQDSRARNPVPQKGALNPFARQLNAYKK